MDSNYIYDFLTKYKYLSILRQDKEKFKELYIDFLDKYELLLTSEEFLNNFKNIIFDFNKTNKAIWININDILIESIKYMDDLNIDTILFILKYIENNNGYLDDYYDTFQMLFKYLNSEESIKMLPLIKNSSVIVAFLEDRRIVEYLLDDYINLKDKYIELEKRYNQLENHIKYMPESEGYYEAKEHFNDLQKIDN